MVVLVKLNALVMKIFTTNQVKTLDRYTITNEPIASVDLMERAAERLLELMVDQFSKGEVFYIFVGPGNNGGDGLAVARMLSCIGKKIYVFLLTLPDDLSPDALINYRRLSKAMGPSIGVLESGNLPDIPDEAIVVDAIFGSGLNRPIEGLAREVIHHINRYKNTIVAIDIPSGLPGEDCGSVPEDAIIRADYTYTLEFPKVSFFFPENARFVGAWTIVPIGTHPKAIERTKSNYTYLLMQNVAKLIPERPFFGHKGTFGHLLVVAGSKGMMGASMLVGKGAYRSGAGLVTCHVPFGQGIVLQIGIPEVLVQEDISTTCFTTIQDIDKYDAISVGPGIGQGNETAIALEQLFRNANVHMVIDADAINLMVEHPQLQELLPANSVLTPHPKELERLVGKWSNSFERIVKQRDYAIQHKVVLLCKGANTTVALPSGELIFNSSGNSGMATGGTGDVLAGIVGGLLAQGFTPVDSALIGVFVHGLAGDIAATKVSKQSLMASDILNFLGDAWLTIK